jgi:hypothetical protein
MCKAFSCLVTIDKKVIWKMGVDSHTSLVELAGYKDNTADLSAVEFARIEITPDNGNYLYPEKWSFTVDERIRPTWLKGEHESVCLSSHKKWLHKLDKLVVRKEIVHPFKLKPPKKITEAHIEIIRQWASVRNSVGDSVGASVRNSVRNSVGDSVGASVGASVRNSVGDSVGASVWNSVGDSVGAYTGSFFILKEWKYIKHPKGEYPFAPCVKLWEQGLVPSFDGKTWRLHGGAKAAILFEITAEELKARG